jgi:hypothetical protein
MTSYDLLFKVPVTGHALPDGIRDVDELFVRSIDQLVDALLAEKGIACERLDASDREHWVETASRVVLSSPLLRGRLV